MARWPFRLTPKGILLEGKDKERAQARYTLEGEELERTLLNIDYDNKESVEYRKALLELDKKYDKIEPMDYDKQLLDINYDNKESVEYRKALLELDKKYDKVEQLEYEKQLATFNGEPWVAYRDYGLEEHDGKTGFWFDFDWNDIFIQKLREEGYEAIDDESLVKKWYAELCRMVALDEGLAMDMFNEEDTEETSAGIRKKRNLNGTIDYS